MSRIFCLLVAVPIALLSASVANAANYKCKGADGKIEYSDSPCDTSKEALSKPQTGVTSRPLGPPSLEQLDKLFADYEPRLCDRERLTTEVDVANRAGEIAKAPGIWKAKQEMLNSLNETLVEFQEKAGKITRPTGAYSPETMALRKFQGKLKDCGKIAPK